jgi:flagellin
MGAFKTRYRSTRIFRFINAGTGPGINQPLGVFLMPMIINSNMNSMTAQRNLATSQSSLSTSMQRLSSGLRVNNASDDAAGLSIATRMDAQVRGINVAIRNANDGISLAQTAEGAVSTTTDILQRMRELAVQAQNASNGTSDRANLDTEYQQLSAEITRVAAATKFNGTAIVGGSAGAQVFQIGANNGDTLTLTTTTITTVAGGLTTSAAASTALAAIDTQINTLTTARANYGAAINRLGFAISNLSISGENQSAAKGRIMDADFASETSNLSRAQILQQAGNAMVAQANQQPQQVMALLR